MNTIYWIETLDSVCGILLISLIIGLVCIFSGAMNQFMTYDGEELQIWSRLVKKGIITSCITGIMFVLVPTTDTMYKIIGIGTIIEYLKSNDSAKQLPDKCIKALDKFLDDVTDNNEQNQSNKQQ